MSVVRSIKQAQGFYVYVIAALVSVLLSCWIGMHDVVINPDGICYIQGAKYFPLSDLQTIMHSCGQAKLPLYSILIYTVSVITHFSYINAALVLNSAFSLVSVLAFITIIRILGGSTRVLSLAAAVILLAHEFNAVREDIIRDHGFWAFYLVSIALLLVYVKNTRVMYAIAWSLAMVCASLFRIEGVIFLLLIPGATWFLSQYEFKQRLRFFLQLNIITMVAALGLVILLCLHPQVLHAYTSRLSEVQFQILHGLSAMTQQFSLSSLALSQHVLSHYATDNPAIPLSLMLIAWYAYSVLSSLSLVYGVLLAYAWKANALRLNPQQKVILVSYLIVNIIITGLFLAENMFVAKRYLMALSLTLMFWLPFALDHLYLQKKRVFQIAIIAMLLTSLGGIFNFGYSKEYIYASGQWLADHAPENAAIYSNDEMILFYSQHFGMDIIEKGQTYNTVDWIANDKWKNYDYLAIRVNKHDPIKNTEILKEVREPVVATFTNTRGDKVFIYKVSH